MIYKGSIEDFLYIIIGVIWLIFSIYKGSQKKKSRNQPTAEPATEKQEKKKPASIFDSFLENLMKEEEDKGVPYEPVELKEERIPPVQEEMEMKEPAQREIFSYDDMAVENSYDYEAESNYLGTEDVYKIHTAQPETLQQELKTHLKKTKGKTRFDLRKAVIYSEILNRRYF